MESRKIHFSWLIKCRKKDFVKFDDFGTAKFTLSLTFSIQSKRRLWWANAFLTLSNVRNVERDNLKPHFLEWQKERKKHICNLLSLSLSLRFLPFTSIHYLSSNRHLKHNPHSILPIRKILSKVKGKRSGIEEEVTDRVVATLKKARSKWL